MPRPFTVYFDTSFYVKLCRADETIALNVLRDLNALCVRHVVSDVLIRELLTSRDRADLDEALVIRVRQFSLPPYQTRDGIAWEVLLLSGQERIDVANILRSLHDEMARAKSYSIMARRETNTEQRARLLEASTPLLKQYGFPEHFEQNKQQVVAAAKAMLEGFGIQGIDWPEQPTPENLLILSRELKGLLGPSTVAQLEEEAQVQDSATTTEDRPYQVAADLATDKTRRRLSNTLRDTEHMMLFMSHRSEIDALQVDFAQEAIIRKPRPQHRIAEVGLADRCFAANSLMAVVDKVSALKDALAK